MPPGEVFLIPMNLELAEKLVGLLGEFPVSEITVETGASRVHVVKPLGSVASVPVDPPVEAALEAESVITETAPEPIRLWSPMVGVFYHVEPPLTIGAEIKPGQVVGSIESMKLMNDVRAEQAGRLTDILIDDGAPVEYGQTLFRLAAF